MRWLLPCALFTMACTTRPTAPTPSPAALVAPPTCGGPPMRVRFFDVGQALSVLVELPDGRAVLVDAGESPKRPGCGAPCEAWHQHLMEGLTGALAGRPISLLWITHQHSDHLGGVPEVLERFSAKVYADNGRDLEKNGVHRARAAAEAHGLTVHVVDATASSPLAGTSDVKLRPVVPSAPPPSCLSGDQNDCSIALRIDYCKSSVLFVGDAEAAEEALLDPFGPVTLLQVGHHGSETSTTEAFLTKVAPKYAVISSGKQGEGTNGTYCHPRKKTIEKLDKILGGAGQKAIRAFDGAVSCKGASLDHWSDVPASDHLFATARDGDVTLVTTGDGVFVRK